MKKQKVVNVVGARPNFMKIAPIMEAYGQHDQFEPVLVHTGQHYDERMSDLFFRELGIPEPDVNLNVGSGSHAVQTAQIMTAFEPVLQSLEPDAVVVVGDVNSSIACGLVAVKMGIPLIHVEAGLRSNDRSMPEEINRVLTDSISSQLYCTEQSGVENLVREGVSREKIFLVGNVMIDTLIKHLERSSSSPVLEGLGLTDGGFALLTLHRPSNVDDAAAFGRILDAVEEIQNDMPVVFPCHPRSRANLVRLGLANRVESMENLRVIDPVGYLDFLRLMSTSKLVLSDSGGVQEETTYMRVPCLTLRENTERPVTLEIGSAKLVGSDTAKILAAYGEIKGGDAVVSQVPKLWDGRSAERIVGQMALLL